ncbi:MAG: hypothetical protein P8R42_13845 [Candidatus Binatia bacterium]|nr:hypothetical protein [Candidatus Binatia bacterium]
MGFAEAGFVSTGYRTVKRATQIRLVGEFVFVQGGSDSGHERRIGRAEGVA